MAIDLHVGEFGADGPASTPAGRIGDQDLFAVQSFARSLGLRVTFAPTADFVISADEVVLAVAAIEDAVREYESSGADAGAVETSNLCNALRSVASRSASLSGFGD